MTRFAGISLVILLLCFCQLTQQQVVVPTALRTKFEGTGMEWEDFIEQLAMQLPGGPTGGSSEPWEAPEPGEEPEPTLQPDFLDPNSTLWEILTNDSVGVSLEQLMALEELPPLPVTDAPLTQTPVTLAAINETLALLSSLVSSFTSANVSEATLAESMDSIINSILSFINDTSVDSVDSVDTATTSRPSNRIYGTTPSPGANPNPLGRTKVDVRPPSYQGSLTIHFGTTVNQTAISNNSTANAVQNGTPTGAQIQVPRRNTEISVPTLTPAAAQSQISGTQASSLLKPKTTAKTLEKNTPPDTKGALLTFIGAPLNGSQLNGITTESKEMPKDALRVVQTKPDGTIRANPSTVSPTSSKVNAARESALDLQGKLTENTQKVKTQNPSGIQVETTVENSQRVKPSATSPSRIQAIATLENKQILKTSISSPSRTQAKTIVGSTQRVKTTAPSPERTQAKTTVGSTQRLKSTATSPERTQAKTTVGSTQRLKSTATSPERTQEKATVENNHSVKATTSSPSRIQPKATVEKSQRVKTTTSSPSRIQAKATLEKSQRVKTTTSSPLRMQAKTTVKNIQRVKATTQSPSRIQPQVTVESSQRVKTTTPSPPRIQPKANMESSQRSKTTTPNPASIEAKPIVEHTKAVKTTTSSPARMEERASSTTRSPLRTTIKSTEKTSVRTTTLRPLLRQAINNPSTWWPNRNTQAVDNTRKPTPTNIGSSRIQSETHSWWENWLAQRGLNTQSSQISPSKATTGIQTPSGVSTLQNQLRGRIGTSGVRNKPSVAGTIGRISRPDPISNDFNVRRRTGTISNVVYAGPDRTAEMAIARAFSGKTRSHGRISLFGMGAQPPVRARTTTIATTTTATTATRVTKKPTTPAHQSLAVSAPPSASSVTHHPAMDTTPTGIGLKTTQSSASAAPVKTDTGTPDPQTTPLPLAALPAALRQTNQDLSLSGWNGATKSAASGRGSELHCGILLLSLILLLWR